MDLPDVRRLSTIPDAALRSLFQRLRQTGLSANFLARLARVGERLDDALRAPMRAWNARRIREPVAAVARVFILHDPVDPKELRAALGELAPWLDSGLIEEAREGVVSRFHLAVADEVYCFGDVPGSHLDAVMPLCGATLELVRAAMPAAPVQSALDMGCGAGSMALLLSRAARRVVATDVSARALGFARLNATLNGIDNAELRPGDLFEAAGGERFDLVVAHPPCVLNSPGQPASTFVHGGTRGDELALRLLAGVPSHLERGGRALVLADWPVLEGDSLDRRARAAIGEAAVDLLVLQSPSKNVDDYCALQAAAQYPELGTSFARAAIAQRDHIERLGLRGIALGLVVVQTTQRERGWTSLLSVRHVSDAPLTHESIDRLMAARRLVYESGSALGTERVAFPTGARRVEQSVPDGGPPAMIVQLPAGRPEWPVVFDAGSAAVLQRVAQAPSVLDAARDIASEEGLPLQQVWERVATLAREALLKGALEVAGRHS